MKLNGVEVENGRRKLVDEVVKEVKDDATITMVLTRRVVDRDSEVIEPKGGRFENFAKNPVFLWAHMYREPSIGKVMMDTMERSDEEIAADIGIALPGRGHRNTL